MALRLLLPAAADAEGMSILQHHADAPPSRRASRREPASIVPSPTHTQLKNFGGSLACLADLRHPRDDLAWQELFADPGPGGITVRGSGASYSDAALNGGGTVAVTTSPARITGWDRSNGLLDIDAGATLGKVLSFAVHQGWTLPVLPGTARATVGGALAADVHGKNHPRSGSFSACVEQVVLMTPGQGVLSVGPDERPEVFWATAGGLGLTGVVRRLRLRLAPIQTSWLTTTDTACADLEELLAVVVAREAGHEHVVAWIDGHAPAGSTGRGVVSATDHVARADLPVPRRDQALTYNPRPWHLRAPATANLVRPTAVRTANTLRLARAKRRPGPRLSDFSEALHPLDSVVDWPVLYGRRGLVQYQFSVPTGQEVVIRTVLQVLRTASCPPALVVLKRLGRGSPGQLSFPSPGWTLALDLPAGAAFETAWLLERLDHLVCAVGGRVYLVKDSRMQSGLVPQMYPRLQEWRTVRDQLDPAGTMTSDLDRRLDLTGRHKGARPC